MSSSSNEKENETSVFSGCCVVPVVGSTEGVSYTIELHEYDNGVGLKEGFHAASKDIE